MFIALGSQHTKHMPPVTPILSSGTCLTTYFFPHYLKNGKTFGGKNFTEHKMCVLIFSVTFVRNIFVSKKSASCYRKSEQVFMHRARYFWQNLTKHEFSYFMKIHPFGANSRNFAKYPKKKKLLLHGEINFLCSEIRTTQTNTMWEHNIGFMNIKSGGTWSWAVKI